MQLKLKRAERSRHLALFLLVMLLPAVTLYSQIVGNGTSLFGGLYLLVTLCVLASGRGASLRAERSLRTRDA